jgi:arylsulfatase A-like enzyme
MESEGSPLNQGFKKFTGYACQRLAHNYYPTRLWRDAQTIDLQENEGDNNITYSPELIHQDAMQFIEDNQDRPFFLYLPLITPHAELVAPERYLKKFRGSFGAETAFKGAGPETTNFKKGPYGSQSEPRAAFAAMINLMDDQIGEIITRLKELHLYENTIIVFTSDNGPHREGGADPDYFDSNGRLRGYKRDLYEGGIRTPLIIHWSGKIKPSITDHVSAFWDFVPTFCDLLNVESPVPSDGISMLPTLTGITNNQNTHDFLYWEFHEQGGKQAIRKGVWKAVRLNVNDTAQTRIELYNLQKDERELSNLAFTHPEMIKEFAELMTKAREPNPVFRFDWETP